MTIELSQAFGSTLTEPTKRYMTSQSFPVPNPQPQPPPQPNPQKDVDHLGKILGMPGNVSGSQEFCNMILFIAFGIFALFIVDSLVKLALKKK